ncbi:MAG: RNHCP domain-containing protein [Rickettsiales bacterium]|jgi:hypothetical protein|nr:RNHCP domain-containing protein [Rickettsiales bacterium]
MGRRFTRLIEDFVCVNCGAEVKGDGYTNHCPECLCSLHVDENPGDRACGCQGLMRPVGVEEKRGETVIIHRCIKCGAVKKNRSAANDKFDAKLAVVEMIGKGLAGGRL